MNELQSQLVMAAFASWALQALKNSQRVAWINADSAKLNRALAVVMSGLSALGIHIVCNKVQHQCVVSWTDGVTILTVLWRWVVQFVMTHGWYKAVGQSK